MDQQPNYITPQGLARLREEYQQLFHVERPRIVETIAWAASNGDRSENADYIYGKRRLREIDSRLRFLTGKIENALVVDPAQLKSDKVIFGATVTVSTIDGEEKIFQIVGEDESEIKAGKISWKSPMAKALMGKRAGDEAVVKKPNGEEVLQIEKLEFKA